MRIEAIRFPFEEQGTFHNYYLICYTIVNGKFHKRTDKICLVNSAKTKEKVGKKLKGSFLCIIDLDSTEPGIIYKCFFSTP